MNRIQPQGYIDSHLVKTPAAVESNMDIEIEKLLYAGNWCILVGKPVKDKRWTQYSTTGLYKS